MVVSFTNNYKSNIDILTFPFGLRVGLIRVELLRVGQLRVGQLRVGLLRVGVLLHCTGCFLGVSVSLYNFYR